MAADLNERPWNGLPPEVANVLSPELPGLAEEIIEAISRAVPDYARPIEGPFGAALGVGVAEALRQFVEMVERPGADRSAGREMYVNLGRGEMRAGRSLDALLAAYRLGARVAWRRLAAAGERAGLEPATLYLLAESIFAYIDELSGESIEGYAREQAASAGESQRLRRRLAGLLVQDPPADAAAVEAAALASGWTLPRSVAAVCTQGEDADRLAMRLGTDAIATPLGSGLCALVPDPDAPGRRAQLDAAFGERLGAIGPALPWHRAGVSAQRARAALALAEDGAFDAGTTGLVVAADHSLELLLGADRELARDISETALAPLREETPASRLRLRDTLEAWLAERGRTERVAAALHVHPQTVRYRMTRLRELLGDRLDDADARLELQVALRIGPRRGE